MFHRRFVVTEELFVPQDALLENVCWKLAKATMGVIDLTFSFLTRFSGYWGVFM